MQVPHGREEAIAGTARQQEPRYGPGCHHRLLAPAAAVEPAGRRLARRPERPCLVGEAADHAGAAEAAAVAAHHVECCVATERETSDAPPGAVPWHAVPLSHQLSDLLGNQHEPRGERELLRVPPVVVRRAYVGQHHDGRFHLAGREQFLVHLIDLQGTEHLLRAIGPAVIQDEDVADTLTSGRHDGEEEAGFAELVREEAHTLDLEPWSAGQPDDLGAAARKRRQFPTFPPRDSAGDRRDGEQPHRGDQNRPGWRTNHRRQPKLHARTSFRPSRPRPSARASPARAPRSARSFPVGADRGPSW